METIQINQQDQVDTDSEQLKHQEAMVKIVDDNTSTPDQQPSDAIVEVDKTLGDTEFKTQEELLEAYNALLAKQTPVVEEVPEEVTETSKASTESQSKPTEESGLDISKYSQEFEEKGELSIESYAELAKQGLPQAVVDSYITGQQVQSDSVTQEIYKVAGGEEGYSSLVEWAGENLGEQGIEAYNKAVSSNDVGTIKLAVQGLQAQFKASDSNIQEPNSLVGGLGKAGQQSDSFESTADLVKAMQKPEYRTNPTYRNSVQRKLQRSAIF